jgi:hypothetical protein
MKISRYWHRETLQAQGPQGKPYELACWGGSDTGENDARANASARLAQLAERLRRGEELQHYEYAQHDIREELVEEIRGEDGSLIGAITRNRYGALVLNAADVFIADIDVPANGGVGWLGRLLGKKPRDKAWFVAAVQACVSAHPDCHAVIYETHSGLRVFLTHQAFRPDDAGADKWLETLGSDPLYRRLCRAQQCFRARLTPKPWRCKLAAPPGRFPRDANSQLCFENWLQRYEAAAQNFSICHRLASVGNGRMTANARALLAVHDAKVLGTAPALA